MDDEKKLDKILDNTREIRAMLETIVSFVNSFIVGVVTVLIIRRIIQK